MKTLTIKVPDELAVRIKKHADRLGISKSAFIRESIEREFNNGKYVEEEPSFYDLVKDDLGCADCGLTDLSTNPKYMEGFGK
jgi:predicted transcriptional regulator